MSLFLAHSQRVGGKVGTENNIIQKGVALGLVRTCKVHCWHVVQICPGEEVQSESRGDVGVVSGSSPSTLSSFREFT